jgi:DNA-binding LacI/PurR family transcriptional regulator
MAPRSRITIRDVAAYAGVSHQTVSRVINNSKRVLPETRERVQAAIEELGYRPNEVARSMALGRTCMLACIAPNLRDYTFACLIEGAEAKAREQGYFLLSSSAKDEEVFVDIIEQLVDSQRVAALMVINPYIDGRYTQLPQNFPCVFIGSKAKDEGIPSITLNDELTAFDATQHLIELGHRRIAMVTGPIVEDVAQDRCAGFDRALSEAGLEPDPSLVIEGDWSGSSGMDAIMYLAEEGQVPTAVFAQNDRMAIGVIQGARQMGINVPSQLSVIGVDDIPLASYFDPPLTTMHQDIVEIGRQAAELLIDHMEHPDASPKYFCAKANLIVRSSTHPI